MRAYLVLVLCCLGCLLTAQETFPTWHADLYPRPDRSLEVSERITVVSEGETVKRGITRSIPHTRTHPVEVLSVERDGEVSGYHTRDSPGQITIYVGDKKKTLRPGTYTYEISYRIGAAVQSEGALDELQFEVIGPEVTLPVGRATATLHLPAGLEVAQYACYTGTDGAAQRNCTIAAPDSGRLQFAGTSALGVGEQLSVAAGFTPGFFVAAAPVEPEAPPSWLEREGSLLVFLLCTLYGLYYAYTSWRKYGVDPPAPRVRTVVGPPRDLSPAAVGYLASAFGGSATSEFTASLLALATRGYLSIESKETSGWLGTQHRYELRKSEDHPDLNLLPGEQQQLFQRIFSTGPTLELRGEYDKFLYEASQAHREEVKRQYDSLRTVEHNFRRVWPLLGLYLLGIAAGVLASIHAGETAVWPWVVAVGIGGIIGLGVYIWLIRQPSPDLVRLRTEIAGLKEYLSLPESKRKRLLNAPKMSREHYEELLPYAIALDIHTKWTAYFQELFDPAAYRPVWYFGTGVPFHAGDFSRHFTQTVGGSATPIQSSASGGGGSVGGGVGGGGAGGW